MAYQFSTLAAATTGTGYQITFSPATVGYVRLACKTTNAEFWVKATPASAGVPTAPSSSPVGGAGTITNGWLRMLTGDVIVIGADELVNPPDPIGGLQIWCVTTGELGVIAH